MSDIGSVLTFIRVRAHNITPNQQKDIARVVNESGGRVIAQISDSMPNIFGIAAYIANVPENAIAELQQHPAVIRAYTGTIPPSTLRGYEDGLAVHAQAYMRLFREERGRATAEESSALREGMRREPLPDVYLTAGSM